MVEDNPASDYQASTWVCIQTLQVVCRTNAGWHTGEVYLQTFVPKGHWNDGAENDRFVVGYVCEWKAR